MIVHITLIIHNHINIPDSEDERRIKAVSIYYLFPPLFQDP